MSRLRHGPTRLLVPFVLAAVGALATGPGCISTPRAPGEPPALDNERSPFLATLIAIFPGLFVHGLGNEYAGQSDRATELMTEEGLGIGALAVGAGLAGLGYLEHLEGDRSSGATEILHRIGEGTSFAGGAALGGFGLVMFLDSWIRDIVEAGSAADKRNHDLRRQYDLTRTVPADGAADLTTAGAPGGALRHHGSK